MVGSTKVKYIYTEEAQPVFTFSYWGPYCQYFGGTYSMLPQITPNVEEMDGPLRCYIEDSFIYKESWPLECDYQILFNSYNNIEANDLSAYYDYYSSSLLIEVEHPQYINLIIYDAYGRSVLNKSLSINSLEQIEFEGFSRGFYCVAIKSKKNIVKSFIFLNP